MNQERRAELLEIEATRIADERRRVAATKDRIALLESLLREADSWLSVTNTDLQKRIRAALNGR